MPFAIAQTNNSLVGFKAFDKYNFIKPFVFASIGETDDIKLKEREERKAEVIANTIEENQNAIYKTLPQKKS